MGEGSEAARRVSRGFVEVAKAWVRWRRRVVRRESSRSWAASVEMCGLFGAGSEALAAPLL